MFYSYAPWLSLNRLIRPCKDVKEKCLVLRYQIKPLGDLKKEFLETFWETFFLVLYF